MNTEQLRVGLIGLGHIARDHHIASWHDVPFARIVAAVDPSPSAREAAAALLPDDCRLFTQWSDLLETESLDAIDICTPNRWHAPIALAALDHGLHVLCEKPLGTTAEEVETLAEASEEANRLVMAAQHFRFKPSCQRLKALADAGRLGSVYHARAQWLRRRMLPPSATFIDRSLSGGGPALDIAVHVIDLALWLMDHPQPLTVSAAAGCHLAQRDDLSNVWGDWNRDRFDVEDFAVGFVRLENEATLMIETSWLAFHSEAETIRVQWYGHEGGALWPEGVILGETARTPWSLTPEPTTESSPYAAEIRAFAEAVREGGPNPVPLHGVVAVARILDGLYRSAREGREVAVG